MNPIEHTWDIIDNIFHKLSKKSSKPDILRWPYETWHESPQENVLHPTNRMFLLKNGMGPSTKYVILTI